MDPSSAGPSAPSLGSSTSHRPQPSTASSSSYAPVLINPTPDGRLTPPLAPPEQAIQLTLRYPYPLPIASLLDVAYTLHHQYHLFSPTPEEGGGASALMLTAAAARAVVILGVVGCDKRWRSRGGWVAAVSGLSVGSGIWEDCAERLGARGRVGAPGNGRGSGKGQSWFLYMTILICISEYLLYLLLLRLSPPSHRPHPSSLRLPSAPRQTDVPFAFHSEDLEYTPRSVRLRRGSAARRGEVGRRLFPLALGERSEGEMDAGPSGSAARLEGDRYRDSDEDEDEEDHYDYNDEDAYPTHRSHRHGHHRSTSHFSHFSTFTSHSPPSDDAETSSQSSSISNSSIIDLPPPLSPNRIIPPSLSVNSGLTLAMTGAQPILGGMVRRSNSSRFLGRSWGSGVVLGSPTRDRAERGAGREMGNGKGKGRGEGSGGGSREREGWRGGNGEEGREGGYGTFQA